MWPPALQAPTALPCISRMFYIRTTLTVHSYVSRWKNNMLVMRKSYLGKSSSNFSVFHLNIPATSGGHLQKLNCLSWTHSTASERDTSIGESFHFQMNSGKYWKNLMHPICIFDKVFDICFTLFCLGICSMLTKVW